MAAKYKELTHPAEASDPESARTVPVSARIDVVRPVRTLSRYGTPAAILRIAPSEAKSVRGCGDAGRSGVCVIWVGLGAGADALVGVGLGAIGGE